MENTSTKKYESIRKALKTALEQVVAAGHSVREFSDFVLDKFGTDYIPHLRQFLGEVGSGEIRVKGLSEKTRLSLFGNQVSAQEREAMIRESAYYLAEKRGFTPGGEIDDWAAAELDVDKRLALESGLIRRSRQALTATATNIEKEFRDIKGAVSTWLEQYTAAEEKERPASTRGDTLRSASGAVKTAVPAGKDKTVTAASAKQAKSAKKKKTGKKAEKTAARPEHTVD